MSTSQRRIVTAAFVAAFAVVAWLLFTWQGPDQLQWVRSSQGKLPETPIRLVKDGLTIGRPADYELKIPLRPGVAVKLEDRRAQGAERPGWFVVDQRAEGLAVAIDGRTGSGGPLRPGDRLTVGEGDEWVFAEGPKGPAALSDWWENNPSTKLFFSVRIMGRSFAVILRAFPVSIAFGIIGFLIAIPFGLILAFMKMAKTRWLRWPATAYVDVVRGTPMFLQILIVYFGLTLLPVYGDFVRANPWSKEPLFLGLDITLWARGLFVLSFNSAAYLCEIFRAGIQSIPKGQMEAARSLGMTVPKAMIYVIIPQTVRRILPTMMSEFILLFKDTALLAAVGIAEMTLRAREVAATTLNQSAYMLAAFFYLVITIPLGRFVQRLEDRLAESEGAGAGMKRAPMIPEPIDSEHVIPHSNLLPTDRMSGGAPRHPDEPSGVRGGEE